MIKKLYVNAFCRPLINNIKLLGLTVTSGVQQGCSLSGVLLKVAMIPLLTKINYLTLHNSIRLYQLCSQKMLNAECIPPYNNIASAYANVFFSHYLLLELY